MSYSPGLKKYFWELAQFKQCDSLLFKDMKMLEQHELYLFKEKNPGIIVRLLKAVEKIHGWGFSEIEILQQMNDNPRVFHWKSVIFPFQGELILTSLRDFNKRVIEQIEEMIPKKTKALEIWMESELTEVFGINKKISEGFGGEHAFIEVKPLCHNRYINYFQIRAWRSVTWDCLLHMADEQKITKNGSFGKLLEQLNDFIMSFEVIREQKYENMFDVYAKRKSPKKSSVKDDYQKNYERKILQKYHLYEYLEDQ